VFYQHVPVAIEWLTTKMGFAELFRYGDPVEGAQMRLARAVIMVSLARQGRASPTLVHAYTQMQSIFMDNVEDYFLRCSGLGIKIVEPLHSTRYGELQFVAEDLEGHHWLFAQHVRDVSPVEWGATVGKGVGFTES